MQYSLMRSHSNMLLRTRLFYNDFSGAADESRGCGGAVALPLDD
jgi:hypothetical protein